MKSSTRLLITLLLVAGINAAALAAHVALRPGHPDHYVVKKGDTLWDIAGKFLRDPWLWPEIWYANPHIRNPHLIYPGDELDLVYVNGRPRLTLRRGPVKLSPGIRSEPVREAIPTIPISQIAPYLSRPYVLEKGQIDKLPYVVGFANEHIAAGAGQQIYVKHLGRTDHEQFDVVRRGKTYRDGKTGEILGYEAVYVGSGRLTRRQGDIGKLALSRSRRAVVGGDRLLPTSSQDTATDFQPHAPDQPIEGTIIEGVDRVNEIGRYDVVVIDRGRHDGLEPGMVLQVRNKGEVVTDPMLEKTGIEREDPYLKIPQHYFPAQVTLPEEEAGLVMIFRAFDRVSFGLVMYASKAIHLHDRVTNP